MVDKHRAFLTVSARLLNYLFACEILMIKRLCQNLLLDQILNSKCVSLPPPTPWFQIAFRSNGTFKYTH